MDEPPSDKHQTNTTEKESESLKPSMPFQGGGKPVQDCSITGCDKNKSHKKKKIRWPDWIQAIATAIIVVITFAYTYYASVQATQMRKAVCATEKQVVEMRTTVEIARKSATDTLAQMIEQSTAMQKANTVSTDALHLNTLAFETAHRPYVGISSASIADRSKVDPEHTTVKIEYKNVGSTPAKSVRVEAKVITSSHPDEIDRKKTSDAATALFPNVPHLAEIIIDSPLQTVLSGKEKLSLFFTIRYKGMDGKDYRYWTKMESGPGVALRHVETEIN
jgi:hypothetical protein